MASNIFDTIKNLLKAAGSPKSPVAQSFESAKQSPARSNVYTKAPTDFRKELDNFTHREILRKSRYLEKNSGLLREYIQSMAIYSIGASGIRPQARTADKGVNLQLERNWKDFATSPTICGRFTMWEVQNLLSRALDRDGELFFLKTKDALGMPKIQVIEAHRICNANSTNDPNLNNGIRYGAYGQVVSYMIQQDDGSCKEVDANSIIHAYDKQQASGSRGFPPLQHAICHLLDQMEMLSNEKRATLDQSKISFHLEKTSGQIDEDDEEVYGSGSSTNGSGTSTTDKAGFTYVTEPGEKVNLLESKRPNANFMPWMDYVARDAIMGGLPWEFIADSSKVGAAGVKLSLAKASRIFKHRQQIICAVMKAIWFYVQSFPIDQGEIMAVDLWWEPEWMLPKQIQLDVSREAYQNRLDIEFGLKSRTEDFAERQMDFEEQMQLRADEAVYLINLAKEKNIPLEMLYKPSFNWLQPGLGGMPGSSPVAPEPGQEIDPIQPPSE